MGKMVSKAQEQEGDLEEACKNLLKHKIFERCQQLKLKYLLVKKLADHLSKLPKPIRICVVTLILFKSNFVTINKQLLQVSRSII